MTTETFDNGVVLITSDVECMRILTEHGLLDKLVPDRSSGANQSSHFFERAEHWCLACRFWDQDVPGENGYTLCMVPKSGFNRDDAAAMFAEVLFETSYTKQFQVEYIEPTEIRNQ